MNRIDHEETFESEINARVSHLPEPVLDGNHCSRYTFAMEGLHGQVPIWETGGFRGTPLPYRLLESLIWRKIAT